MRRWKVDTHAKMDSILMLSSVNLPGGELVSNSHMYQIFSVSARPEFLGVINDPLFENLGVIGKFRGSELF